MTPDAPQTTLATARPCRGARLRAPALGLLLAMTAAQGCAAPEVSRRPEARPMILGLLSSIRPEARPDVPADAIPVGARSDLPDLLDGATGPMDAQCGSPTILGERIAPIAGALAGCGLDEPVRVSAVAGVALSDRAVLDCGTARALEAWVEGGVKPAVGRRGGGLAELQVAAHYVCRTRNHRPGAEVSEHGRGRAIDISAVTLSNGRQIGVAEGWRHPRQGRVLRRMHESACGPFGTVLGPEADAYHQDHLHLDTTPRRTAYCR